MICLQEVHATPDLASFWTQEWGGAASWNYHTAILLSPSLGNATFADHHDGHVLASTFRYQGRSFSITNIYAPHLVLLDTLSLTLFPLNPLISPPLIFLWVTGTLTQIQSWTVPPPLPLLLIAPGHTSNLASPPSLMLHSVELRNSFSPFIMLA